MELLYFIQLCFAFFALVEGKLKCKGKTQCFWNGDCNNNGGGATGCPKNYVKMHEYRCLDPDNSINGKVLYHCCKDSIPSSSGGGPSPDGNLPYLNARDQQNAMEFPDIMMDGIPLPYPTPPQQLRNAQIFKNPWPGAQAAYTMDKSFYPEDRAEVYKAIDEYHKRTCFRFYPKTDNDTSYISIESDAASDTGNNCGLSEICGPVGRGQYSKFGGRCRNAEWMIHELGHSICFFHEQDRNDRDTYIYYRNGCWKSYKQSLSQATTLALPFDFYSIMMYPGCRPGDCIQRQSGQGFGYCGSKWNGSGRLTDTDVKKINAYYKCDCSKFLC